MIGSGKSEVTTTELIELIKRSSLPTILVEGKDDIIFYRSFEDGLKDLGVDMLPAGNKNAVLALKDGLKNIKTEFPILFVVDKDLWVYPEFASTENREGLITTEGYSIENDLFEDGGIIQLMTARELELFKEELNKFVFWYALTIDRHFRQECGGFRTPPGKVLDDVNFYDSEIALLEGETYPEEIRSKILAAYGSLVRGKSLFALLVRRLSDKKRAIKFGVKQLMAIGASQKGPRYLRLEREIRSQIEKLTDSGLSSGEPTLDHNI